MWTPTAAAPGTPGRGLAIALAAVVALALLAAAVVGGWALGRSVAASRQPAPQVVSAPFISFQVAPGWSVGNQTRTEVDLRNGLYGSMVVRLGDARQAGFQSDADVFRAVLGSISQDRLRSNVGSCLPVTNVRIGGRAGEEVGFLFLQTGDDGVSVHEDCELAWASVRGGRYESWTAVNTVNQLPALVRATQSMQETAVWAK